MRRMYGYVLIEPGLLNFRHAATHPLAHLDRVRNLDLLECSRLTATKPLACLFLQSSLREQT